MTLKERLRIIREDIRKKSSYSFEDLKQTGKECGKATIAGISGMMVGAVEYAPFCFAMPTFMRRSSKKNIPIDESGASEFYRFGKYTGGALSNLAIQGGWLWHSFTHDNFIRNYSAQIGAIVLGNLASRGYEYWRRVGERAKEQKNMESIL